MVNDWIPHTQKELETGGDRDEIILLGFSRGAYTARAIESLVRDIGLLTHVGMEELWGIFGEWMKQSGAYTVFSFNLVLLTGLNLFILVMIHQST